MEKLLIGILSYNRLDFTKKCIESLYKNTNKDDFELVIFDNGSNLDVLHYLDELHYPNLTIECGHKNYGVAGGLNHILKHRKPNQHFMKLDNDIVFKPGTNKNWIKEINKIFNTPIVVHTGLGEAKIGCICVKPYTWDEEKQIETNLVQEYPEQQIGPWKFQYNPEGVLGCSTVFKSEIFNFFKGFDESFIYGYEESLLHCLMLKNNYVSFFNNEIARVYHIDPGIPDEYLNWKHQQARDNFQLYLKKYTELTK